MSYSKSEQIERESFVDTLVENTSDTLGYYEVRNAALLLMRHAKTYHRIQEMWCSVEMTPKQVKYWEHREQLLEKRITEICKSIGCEPIFEGDPRGCDVLVKVPTGYTDDWGHSGVCVPIHLD